MNSAEQTYSVQTIGRGTRARIIILDAQGCLVGSLRPGEWAGSNWEARIGAQHA